MKTWFQMVLLAVGLWSTTAAAKFDTFGPGAGSAGPLTMMTAGTVLNRYVQLKGPSAPGDNVLLEGPVVQFDSTPAQKANTRTAVFAFSADGSEVTFECRLDDELFEECTSPQRYDGLVDAHHIFYVKAKDAEENEGPLLTYIWQVDLVPPETQLDSKPANQTKSTNATFEFSSTDLSGVDFECALDGGDYVKCSSPKTYNLLGEGAHSFSVRAVDGAGNRDVTPASFAWTVTLTAPDTVIDSFPQKLSNSRDAEFKFSWKGDGVRFECALDSLSFISCPSSKFYAGLQDGSHTFYVRAVDLLGNEDKTPAQYVWTIDATPPTVDILEPQERETVGTRRPLISGKTDPKSRVRVFIDGQSAGPEVLADNDGFWFIKASQELSNGEHVVDAEATDVLDNRGQRSKPVTFTIDTEPPDTEIKEPLPLKLSNSRSAAFIFGSPNGAMLFECNLQLTDGPDTPEFFSCGASHVFTNLSNGEYTLRVRAKDSASNVDPTPATYKWVVRVKTPPYPEIQRPRADEVVDTGTPEIIGTAEPRGTVTVYLDGEKNGIALADEEGHWVFRPSSNLLEGPHTVSGETTDEIGNPSEERSPERAFTVLSSQLTGGGVGCAVSGSQPFLHLLGLGLLLHVRRRCRARGHGTNRSHMS